ncbi:MAG: hypothetical protein IJX08_07620 [Clostridia bacterium]|nr:hypothetical protein [Clostridia bacterium]
MFFHVSRPSVRTVGRWAPLRHGMATTAPGSTIELAFTGPFATLYFDIENLTLPYPHLWIGLDGGAHFEVPVERYLRVQAPTEGEHFLRIVYKGARETANRWHHPLQGYVLFTGFEAQGEGTLPADNRKTIELVGDSITEGVLIDPQYAPNIENDQYNRPYQDDSLATYGALLAKELDLVPLFCGYGAVGVTKGGCGGVPSAPELYDFCFEGAPVGYPPADCVLINHGTNDRHTPHLFKESYTALLDRVFARNPQAQVVALIPFCGAFKEELQALIPAYCAQKKKAILLIDTTGWLPPDPLHPLRDGHIFASKKSAEIMRAHLDL